MDSTQRPQLPTVLTNLLKGVIYREQTPELWRDILSLQAQARDYVRLLGLELVIDEVEGYAFLRQVDTDESNTGEVLPRLIARRPLSYPVSLLLVALRKRLAQHDAQGGETRLVLSRDQIAEMMRTFLPASTNDAKLADEIDRHISRTEEMGFLRQLKENENLYEVRRILRAFVNADWLAELEALYREHGQRLG
jgi:hypothetical protein